MRNKKLLFINIVIFIFLFILAYLFIYSGDDWAWGSSIGMERLSNFFYNYNGRYLGNLIVLILTRSRILKALVTALILLGIINLIRKIINKDNYYIIFITFCLIVLMPKSMFRQSIVWVSGFTNYAIPVILILLYFYHYKNHKENKLSSLFVFIIGICSCLFMEHITIYCFLLSIFIIFKDYVKAKKISLYNIMYFLGNLIGSIIMFSNKAYFSITTGEDTYRTIYPGISDMMINAKEAYLNIIQKDLIFNNIFLVMVIIILMSIIIIRYLKCTQKNKVIYISWFIIVSYGLYQLLSFINPEWQIMLKYTSIIEGVYTFLFFVSIIIITIFTVDDKSTKYQLLFYLISILILTLPLFVVNPIGPRCFFPMYILFILFICTLFNNLEVNKTIIIKKEILILTIFIIVFSYIYLLSIYLYIYMKDIDRINYIHKEINNGATEITVKKLPYPDYVWNGDVNDRYKIFYGIDKKIVISNKD